MRLQRWSALVLAVVAAVGAVLSFDSLHTAAVPTFADPLAYGFPLLTDALILGASLQFIAGARQGRPQAGWRVTAHAGVAGTIVLNGLAAPGLGAVPWHVTAPIVWSVLVELTARTVLGQWRATHRPSVDRIPLRLWLGSPRESAATWLRMARRLEGEQRAARLETGVHQAAVEALRLAVPGRDGRRVRGTVIRQLRAGSLPPEAVLRSVGWLDPGQAPDPGQRVLRAALGAALGQPEVTDDRGDTGPDDGGETRHGVTDPVRVEVVSVGAVPAPEPVPEPAPVAAATRERPRRVTQKVTQKVTGEAAGPRTAETLLPRVQDAVCRGDLDPHPTAEAIRRHLHCSSATARALRNQLAADTTA